ncbi:MAG: hypothetical protein ABI782_03645 [Anaerolineaceae bacterium]
MNLHLTKPWLELNEESVARVPGQLGIYQLANADGAVLYIGYAGGKALFGLRSEIQRRLGTADAVSFRYEVNMQYLTRYKELLMLHKADHAQLPTMNASEPPVRLGRLS